MDFSPDTLNCISFCAGGGGLDLAVELAIPSARTVCMVEREAYACAVLVEAMRQGLLAPAPMWTDARTFRGKPWRGLVDGLFGGIPCQPHSEAGDQLGAEDERDLWAPTRRTIVQARPWWVLIENVGGMLSTGGAGRVHRDLRRLGFAVEAGLFMASECGAPHERERLFILGVADALCPRGEAGIPASPGGDGLAAEPAVALDQGDALDHASGGRHRDEDEEICSGRSRPEHAGGELVDADRSRWKAPGARPLQHSGPQSEPRSRALADTIGGELDGGPEESRRRSPVGTAAGWPSNRRLFPPGPDDDAGWREYLTQRPDAEPAVRRGSDGLAYRVDRIRVLGNGVVSVVGGYALRYLATSLAYQGSRAAARLVHLMGIEL